MEPGVKEPVYERLAYEAAQRALDKQERLLEELRSRTGLLFAAASLAASFLAGEAFSGDPSPALAAVALTGFLVAMGSSVYVLLPKVDKFVFAEVQKLLRAFRLGAVGLSVEIVVLIVMVGDNLL